MLTLSYFTKFPATFKDREKLVKDVKLKNIKAEQLEDKITVSSNTDKNNQIIEIQGNNITLNTAVKVFCDCESFKYDFAHSVYKSGSLAKSYDFIRSIIQRPKKRNVYDIPSGCKHIVALARECLKVKIK